MNLKLYFLPISKPRIEPIAEPIVARGNMGKIDNPIILAFSKITWGATYWGINSSKELVRKINNKL